VAWVGGKFISNLRTPLFDKTKERKEEKQRALIEQMNDVVNRLENLWGVLTTEKLTIICGKTEDNEKTIKQNKKKFTSYWIEEWR